MVKCVVLALTMTLLIVRASLCEQFFVAIVCFKLFFILL